MPALLSPCTIRNIRLGNRIVMPPMANNLATDAGEVTPAMVEHYTARARANVALLIMEHNYVAPAGQAHSRQPAIDRDAVIPGLQKLAGAVHAAGAKIALQISHAGSAAARAVLGQPPVAPSAVIHPKTAGGELPRELAAAEIDAIIAAFAAAAGRVQAAGFDAVEIHGAHGYLLNQFYSPLTNRRDDAYGGSREKRLALPLAVVKAVRQTVGPDFAVFYRLGADDMLPGGLTVEDACFAAPRLAAAGVDLLDISGGLGGSRPAGAGAGYFVPLAEAVKAAVAVPVLVTGGITAARQADRIVREGKADLVGIGRALLADPQWAAKAAAQLQ